MDESRHKSRPNPSKGMASEVYRYKDPRHTKGLKIAHKENLCTNL